MSSIVTQPGLFRMFRQRQQQEEPSPMDEDDISIVYLNKTRGYLGFKKNIIDVNNPTIIEWRQILCMYSIIIRILLFLDQLHDFNEADDRNQLYSKCSKFNKESIYENIKKLCEDDIKYIYEKFKYKETKFKEIKITSKIRFVQYYERILKSANDIKKKKYEFITGEGEDDEEDEKDEDEEITNGILEVCKLKKHNKFNTDTKFTCVDNYKDLPNQIYEYNYKNSTIELNPINELNIYIDAGKSKYNSSMISNFVCNILNNDNNKNVLMGICSRLLKRSSCSETILKVNQKNTPASYFDSSKDSGLYKLIQKLKILQKDEKNLEIKENFSKSYGIKLLSDSQTNIELISFKYIRNDYSWVKHILSIRNDKYYVKSDVTDTIINILYTYIYPKNTTPLTKEYKEYKKNKINEAINNSTHKYYYKNIIYDKFELSKIPGDVSKLIQYKKEINEYIEKIKIPYERTVEYSLAIPRFFNTTDMVAKYSTNCSAKKISEEIVSNKNFTNMYYKTLGDFGQILTTYSESVNNNDPKKLIYTKFSYFYTFDQICSYISALFNPGTLLENDKNPVYPIDIFISTDIKFIKNTSVIPSKKAKTTGFGKTKSKTKKSKTKKSKSRVSLELKRLQKKAKKLRIRITKTVRGKRKYKTVKE